jgi:S-DNA-T family DNA segregation ATPase FtsK/SpoIIIE
MVFRVHLNTTAHLKKVLKLGEEVGLALNIDKTPRVSRAGSLINVEIVLPDQFRRSLPVEALPQEKGLWATVGQTVIGQSVRVNLTGVRTCHSLISGMTGSGKTVLQWLVAWIIVKNNHPKDVRMLLIDGKGGTRWNGFQDVPHLLMPVIGDPADAVRALAWVVMTMDARKKSGVVHPTIFVIIDELRDLITVAGDEIATALDRLTAVGRELGIHVIAATQKPLSDAVGGSIAKANFPARWCGSMPSAQDAYIATGKGDTGAHCLNGLGDFVFVAANSTHRIQVALIGTEHLGALQRSAYPAQMPNILGDLDLSRVLGVTKVTSKRTMDEIKQIEMLAWALANPVGAKKIREQFGGAMDTARFIRRLAQGVRGQWKTLGVSSPKRVAEEA